MWVCDEVMVCQAPVIHAALLHQRGGAQAHAAVEFNSPPPPDPKRKGNPQNRVRTGKNTEKGNKMASLNLKDGWMLL